MIALIIPVTGLLEVIDSPEENIDPEVQLFRRGNSGHLITAALTRDDEAMGTVYFHVNGNNGIENPRARQAIVTLTGAHMVVQGCAFFTDVPLTLMRDIVQELSRKE